MLSSRDGDVFDAVVIDEGEWGCEIQIPEPAVLGAGAGPPRRPGRRVQVRLARVDVDRGAVTFDA